MYDWLNFQTNVWFSYICMIVELFKQMYGCLTFQTNVWLFKQSYKTFTIKAKQHKLVFSLSVANKISTSRNSFENNLK